MGLVGNVARLRQNRAVATTNDSTSTSDPFWLELFFDLVVVAAMVVLATALEHEATWTGIGVFSVTFAAIWMAWVSVALYVNAADSLVERRTVIAAMAAIAVMAASLLDLREHADTFAIAFLLCRGIAFGGTLRAGRLYLGWTAAFTGATAPWLISLFVPDGWKFVLWGVGLIADLISLWLNNDSEADLRRLNRRHQRRNPSAEPIQAAPLRSHHFTERLGTFLIIVLGESVLQLVRAVSETEWSSAMWFTAVPDSSSSSSFGGRPFSTAPPRSRTEAHWSSGFRWRCFPT